MIRPFAIFAKGLFYGPGKRSYSSGASTRIAKAILGVQSAGFALFMDWENAHTVAVHMAAGCCCVFYERWRL